MDVLSVADVFVVDDVVVHTFGPCKENRRGTKYLYGHCYYPHLCSKDSNTFDSFSICCRIHIILYMAKVVT